MKKSQASMEYILITAFSLLVAIPLVILFFEYGQSYNDEVTLSQADKVMDDILNTAETVYYLGEPSQKTISVYFPNNIEEISLYDGYFTFKLSINGQSSTLYRTSPINFTGNINTFAGLHMLKIVAVNNTIQINSATG